MVEKKQVRQGKRITIGSDQSKSKEIPIPFEVLEQIFDESGGMWYETEEEREYREQKEDYNKSIISQIKKINFTDRQKQIFLLMYKEGLSLTETARKLGEPITTIQTVKNDIIKKIKREIRYEFKYQEEQENSL